MRSRAEGALTAASRRSLRIRSNISTLDLASAYAVRDRLGRGHERRDRQVGGGAGSDCLSLMPGDKRHHVAPLRSPKRSVLDKSGRSIRTAAVTEATGGAAAGTCVGSGRGGRRHRRRAGRRRGRGNRAELAGVRVRATVVIADVTWRADVQRAAADTPAASGPGKDWLGGPGSNWVRSGRRPAHGAPRRASPDSTDPAIHRRIERADPDHNDPVTVWDRFQADLAARSRRA